MTETQFELVGGGGGESIPSRNSRKVLNNPNKKIICLRENYWPLPCFFLRDSFFLKCRDLSHPGIWKMEEQGSGDERRELRRIFWGCNPYLV